MKKVFILLVAAACVAVSCKQEIKGEVLSPEENKATLDETCTKAVQMLEVDHWQSTADLITASAEVFGNVEGEDESYTTWAESVNKSFTVSDKEPYEYLYDLSKINGTISIKDNKVYAEEGTGLGIAYALADGTAVDGKLTVKNSKTTALVDTDYSYYYDESGNLVDKKLWSKTYLVIPESIEGTLNAGGKKTAGLKLTTDIKLAGEEPMPTDTYAATLEVSADKYTFAVTRAKYSDTEILLNASIKYDKQTIVAANFEAKGKLAFDADNDIDALSSTGNVKATFSLLDNVELKGDLNYTEFVKAARKGAENEAEAKALAAAVEKCVNLTLYIQKTAQAKLGFEAYKPYESEDMVVWSIQPVVRFEDGSEYMLPDEFFSPDNFPKTVEAVNNALAEMQAFLAGPQQEAEPLK